MSPVLIVMRQGMLHLGEVEAQPAYRSAGADRIPEIVRTAA